MGKVCARAIVWAANLLACCACAFALDPSLDVSQYAHTSWKIRDGFSKGLISSITQTPDGYLWLGTEFGLLRFDGVRNVPWKPPVGEHLPSDFIRSLLAAHDGTLWIGTWKGLASWKDGKLKQYPELSGQAVDALLEDHEETVWVGSQGLPPGRLCAIHSGNIRCYGEDGRFGRYVESLYEDSRGNLWAGAATGLWRWKPGPPKLYPLPDQVGAPQALSESDNGTLLVAMRSGIRQLVDGRVERYPLPVIGPQFRPGRLLRDRNGGIWIATIDQGLVHLHQGRTDVFAQSDGLSSDAVTQLFEDREGNIWLATVDGLDRFRELAVPTISVKQGLSGAYVGSVLTARDGSIWVGTSDGLHRWNNGQITLYRKRNGRAPAPPGTLKAVREIRDSGLPDGGVNSLFQDDRGQIWVSTNRGVAYLENGRFVRANGVPDGYVYSIAGDDVGNLWISNQERGLIHLLHGNVVEQIPWDRLGARGSAATLLVDSLRGGLWLGFWQGKGGVEYFKDGQVRAPYAGADGFGEGKVMGLQIDPDGTLWAATESGLSRVRNGRVTTLTSKNGLPCDTLHWMMEDDARSIWMEMACGVVRVARSELDAWITDPKRRIQVTVLDSSDGVRSHANASSYSPRVAKSADGKLWFTPWDGVSVIDPRHLALNKLPPPVHIEQIIADGKTYDLSPQGSGGMHLPPRVRDLTIDYTALSLVVPEKVRFRFKLEGQDADWREVVNQRRVEYSNLAPRHYRFRVLACNNSGVWNEEGAALDFAVDPAYWQTNWFRSLCGLTVVAMLWTVYRLRVGALERRQAAMEQHQALLERHQGEIRALNEQMIKAQESERMRISGELHDSVLQQITSLTLRLGKVKRQVPPDSEAKETVNVLQQQLIQIGTDIRHISHELHPALLQESGLPAALSSYCDEFSKVRGLPVSCETDENVQELSPGAALCLYRIAQEALGNAAKYSAAKKVEVRLTRADGRVCLSVSDDGVGCDPNQTGKSGGLGVINMRERVLQLKGTFEFDSAPGRGTTVRAEVPFRPAS